MNVKEMRGNKNIRLVVMLVLIALAAGLFYFSDSKAVKTAAVVAGGVAAVGVGLEVADTDFDLETLIETGSFKEALLARDEKGNLLNIQGICDATEYNYNCSDFVTQNEANAVAKQCEFDVFGLDRDKDGIVCEALPIGL